MSIELTLSAGLTGEAELVVAETHTAPHVGSGRVHVLATPVMVNLMEAAALRAVEAHLPEGCQSLGTRLDVEHVAATPVGMRVRAVARLIGVDGRMLRFELDVEDERERVGGGRHDRVVVDVARFVARVEAKRARGG